MIIINEFIRKLISYLRIQGMKSNIDDFHYIKKKKEKKTEFCPT